METNTDKLTEVLERIGRGEVLDFAEVCREAIVSEFDCRHCRLPVKHLDSGRYAHLVLGGTLLVSGCRAASFEPSRGWDETLLGSWHAEVQRR